MGGTGFLGIALTVSVFLSARREVGQPPPSNLVVTQEDLRACADGLDELFSELTERLRAVPAATPGASQDEVWATWMPTWRKQLLAIGARCRLLEGTPEDARPLREAYVRLDKLQWLYTTHVVQYAREIGPRADETRASLANAKARISRQ
jgi:hypothetical protein